jgi:hypothetical protein
VRRCIKLQIRALVGIASRRNNRHPKSPEKWNHAIALNVAIQRLSAHICR